MVALILWYKLVSNADKGKGLKKSGTVVDVMSLMDGPIQDDPKLYFVDFDLGFRHVPHLPRHTDIIKFKFKILSQT